MRIKDMIARCGQFVSLEFFPPKDTAAWPGFFEVVERLRSLRPMFVSVTYGAGGGTQANTLEIVTRLKRDCLLEPMAHLTCVGASEEAILEFLASIREAGIDNVLALRGDPPKDQPNFSWEGRPFRYAGDLVRLIRRHHPDMGVGVAGYPETHPEATSPADDLEHLKRKVDEGADFVVTQLFFDNRRYFDFVDRVRAAGMDIPVLPGVMPVLGVGSIERILSMCGATMPKSYRESLEQADRDGGAAAVLRLSVEHARRQVRELLEAGAPGVHLYTLNKAEACLSILDDPAIKRMLHLD